MMSALQDLYMNIKLLYLKRAEYGKLSLALAYKQDNYPIAAMPSSSAAALASSILTCDVLQVISCQRH